MLPLSKAGNELAVVREPFWSRTTDLPSMIRTANQNVDASQCRSLLGVHVSLEDESHEGI